MSATKSVERSTPALPRANDAFSRIALVLQGGGALGAYQAGVFEALDEHGVVPNWVAGISIGAINSAIIAGNAPRDRVARLREFWELVTSGAPPVWGLQFFEAWQGDEARRWINQLNAGGAMIRGVPGFYTPRLPPPYVLPLGAPGATSYYDTAPLAQTLERLVDFDRINAGAEMRLSVGAVNVRTGNFTYFDSTSHTLEAAHVMASGALPPAFQPVEIDGEYYWDGGIVSNTPLQWVLGGAKAVDTLIFQVDLWSARGALPRSLSQVATRLKEIQYSSRTRAATDGYREIQKARDAVALLLARLPRELLDSDEVKYLSGLTGRSACNIVELIYTSPDFELESKDYEFSRATMREHWRRGYDDARTTLAHPEIYEKSAGVDAVRTFDYCTER